MRVIITGGGTGGHIYPALAIADCIRKNDSGAEILFIGTERGLEKDIVPKSGYNIDFIEATGFNRKSIIKNVKTVRNLIKSSAKMKKIIDDFKPDIVIGTGGYVTGAVVREAAKKGIRCFIHEQNVFPGMTNKLLEKHVEKIFLGFDEARKYFKKQDKIIFTGNPVRDVFHNPDPEAKKRLGLKEEDFTILSFGGSLGANIINNKMIEVAKSLHDVSGVEVVMVTGRRHFEQVRDILSASGIIFEENDDYSTSRNIRLIMYADNLPDYMAASDLVITRAGALTVSEIMTLGKASILVPSPNVTGNHQYYNAKVLADKGAAVMIEEKDLEDEKILDAVISFKNRKGELEKIQNNCKSIEKVNATQIIYENMK